MVITHYLGSPKEHLGWNGVNQRARRSTNLVRSAESNIHMELARAIVKNSLVSGVHLDPYYAQM